MKLVVGLGNPGKGYRFSRHNIGFLVIEEFAKRHRIQMRFNRSFNALVGESIFKKAPVYLLMPQTYMNMSGIAVRDIMNYIRVGFQDTLIILDDVALGFGKIRIRPKGSDGGHKGLRSIIDALATSEVPRMRIGIKGREIREMTHYVLAQFTSSEKRLLPEILDRATLATETWIEYGIEKAMNRFNAAYPKGR